MLDEKSQLKVLNLDHACVFVTLAVQDEFPGPFSK